MAHEAFEARGGMQRTCSRLPRRVGMTMMARDSQFATAVGTHGHRSVGPAVTSAQRIKHRIARNVRGAAAAALRSAATWHSTPVPGRVELWVAEPGTGYRSVPLQVTRHMSVAAHRQRCCLL